MATDWEALHNHFTNLAKEEESLNLKPYGVVFPGAEIMLTAIGQYDEFHEYGNWAFGNTINESIQERFAWRAAEAGKGLERRPPDAPPIEYWLHSLREYLEGNPTIIRRVIPQSAIYCAYLQRTEIEKSALSKHAFVLHTIRRTLDAPPESSSVDTPPDPSKMIAPNEKPPESGSPMASQSVGEQIDRYRAECRLSIEELAHKIDINPRTVQRHIANDSMPYPRHLLAYERFFSKVLEKKIVIVKMP